MPRLSLVFALILGAFDIGTACAFEMRADPAFSQKSSFGLTVGRDAAGQLLIGSEAITGATVAGAASCSTSSKDEPGARHELASNGWIRVYLNVPARWVQRYEHFDVERSNFGEGWTNGQALRTAFQSANELLAPMVRDRIKPSVFRVEIALVPADCHSVDVWEAAPAQAMQELVLRLHVQEPMMLESLRFRGLFRWLLAVVAHESMHAMQLAPFDAQSLAEADPAPGPNADGAGSSDAVQLPGGHLLSPRLELPAMLLEHCITEAIVPREPPDRALADAWRGDPSLLERLRSPLAPEIDLLIRRFEWLQAVTGGVVYPDDEAGMAHQLSACAAVIRDPGIALARAATPTEADIQAAAEGLRTARRLAPALRPASPSAGPHDTPGQP